MEDLHKSILRNLDKEPEFLDIKDAHVKTTSFFCKTHLLAKYAENLAAAKRHIGDDRKLIKDQSQKVSVFAKLNESYFGC